MGIVMEELFDIIVVGGGIAGCGIAAFLAERARVLVLEKEAHPGTHATGRSAALFSETYGADPIRALSRASNAFLTNPPEAFNIASPLLPRGCLYVASAAQEEKLLAAARNPLMRSAATLLSRDEALSRCPILKPDHVTAALWEPGAQDLEVNALLQAFIRRCRALGGVVRTDSAVVRFDRRDGLWRVATEQGRYQAPVVVNAAGAWADSLAAQAGLAPLGIQPLQRTALLVPSPDGVNVAPWPCVIDIDEAFYFKPDGGHLLLSPADEHPVEPYDAQPDEMDVAIAVDRVEQATSLRVRRVLHKWAGLRSFAPDRVPVVGFDPRSVGFFWLAGQGGYGIQTAPALSQAAAALLLDGAIPGQIADHGVDMAVLRPDRLIPAAVPH
ncbi:FAD-dependent oxidoreductase [Nitrospirillum viridazoti Y2]|nr:FAD-dependent oxidoreductase [Nitrospirillum amazonense]EGY01997.1 FAD-dependent oxidoreductase [Nitrospirillum amazonense Y2]